MDFADNAHMIEIEVQEVLESQGGGGGYPEYKGDYEVIPKTEEQVLPTKGKNMGKDVTIKAIPTFEVSNEHGTTFIIGGI